MSDVVHTEEYKGYSILVTYDPDTEDPRKWGTFGKVYTWHRRYKIGDKHDYACGNDARLGVINANGRRRAAFSQKAYQDAIFVELPVYMYEHSGRALSTAPFSCPWDSGQLGFTFVTKKAAREWFGVKNLTEDHKKQAEDLLNSELKTLNHWMEGEVYCFDIENSEGEREEFDSVASSGYNGADWEYMLEQGRSAVDEVIEVKAEKAKKQEESLATQGAGI